MLGRCFAACACAGSGAAADADTSAAAVASGAPPLAPLPPLRRRGGPPLPDLAPWRVLKRAGAGAVGIVYQVRRRGARTPMALKAVQLDAPQWRLEMLKREVRRAGARGRGRGGGARAGRQGSGPGQRRPGAQQRPGFGGIRM
jgi:hypothetical protein